MSRRGTIVDMKDFDAVEKAHKLFKAVDGFGTDEGSIIDIVTSCNNKQRQQIKHEFYQFYRKDLIKEFKSELTIYLSFDFKQLLQSLFMTSVELNVTNLKASVKGLGTDEKTLVEILLTTTASEMNKVRTRYQQKYHVTLEDDVADDTSGNFRKLVYHLCRAKRSENAGVNVDKAAATAAEIHETFTKYRGTDTPRFDLIGYCCTESFPQMKETFKAYEKIAGKSISNLVETDFHGDTAWGLRCAVKCANSMPGFLAERLFKSLDSLTTNDEALIRIIVSRAEIDLDDIKTEFEKRYHKSLESKIKNHTSRQFKKLLLAILRGNSEQHKHV